MNGGKYEFRFCSVVRAKAECMARDSSGRIVGGKPGPRLGFQRRKIAILASKTGTLRARGQDLLAESILLSAILERSSRDLADIYVLTKKVLTGVPLRGSGRQDGVPSWSLRKRRGAESKPF